MSSSRHDRRQSGARLADERLEAVVVAASEGEGWAVAELYKELHPPLLAYLRSQEPRHGDDLASDTWLKAAAGLPSFSGDASAFRSWLFAIARCRMIDHRRRARRRGTVIDLDALAGQASGDDPEDETLDAVTAQAAGRTIAALPADQADVVLLRVVSGLKTQEVAAIMGKREGTIRVLQHRALRSLSRLLGGDL